MRHVRDAVAIGADGASASRQRNHDRDLRSCLRARCRKSRRERIAAGVGRDIILETGDDSLRIHGFRHGIRDEIDPVAHARQVAPELFDKRDQLGDLLLGDQVDLELQVAPLESSLGLSILCRKHHGGDEKS